MTWEQKELHISNLIECIPIKRPKVDDGSRRQMTKTYFLVNSKNISLQVCFKIFLKEQMIRNWLDKKQKFGLQISPTVERMEHLRNVRNTERVKNLQERITHMELFLKRFPKLESHYCRKDTTKLYFQTTHQTKKEVYNDYLQLCTVQRKNRRTVTASVACYVIEFELLHT